MHAWLVGRLEGQYVLKDIILVAAGMVIATRFRVAQITLDEPSRDVADRDRR